MFRKLFKYEWTAMFRAMLPVYAALILLSIVNFVMYSVSYGPGRNLAGGLQLLSYLQLMTAFLYSAVLFGMMVFAVVVIVQRFYKGLLRQEGYLMFTLPVKTWELVFSKACVSLLVGIISMLVAGLSVGILGGGAFLKGLITLPGDLVSLMLELTSRDPAAAGTAILYFLELIILSVTSFFAVLYRIYASISLGHLSHNHKILCSVGCYVLIDIALKIISFMLMSAGIPQLSGWFMNMPSTNAFHVLMSGGIVFNLIYMAVFWWITIYILERKLNLE